MKQIPYFLLLILIISVSCHTGRYSSEPNRAPSKMVLSEANGRNFDAINDETIRNYDSLLVALSRSLEDTLDRHTIAKRLNMFLDGKYNLKQAKSALQLDRMGLKNFEFTHDSVDTTNWPRFKNAEELKAYLGRLNLRLKSSDDSKYIKVRTKTDSTRKKN